jgi:hypothetical protein
MTSEKQFSANRLNAQQQIGEVGAKVVILTSVDRKDYKKASARQLDANRQNAKKSTGPRSPEGKMRSSRNALIHGLSAMRCLLAHEDREALQQLREDLYEEYPMASKGGLNLVLIELAASLAWRLMRVPEFEAQLLSFRRDNTRANDELFAYQQGLRFPPKGVDLYPMGRTLNLMLEKDGFRKLSRYGGSLLKQLLQVRNELEKLKASGPDPQPLRLIRS